MKNPDMDPIPITSSMDPTLEDDEMIIHTMIEPTSIANKEKTDD